MSLFQMFSKRNVFDLSHERKLSCDMGSLIPILCEEVMPGDTFKLSTDILVRLAPMLAPMMAQVNVYTHYFFVPNRLIWDGWEDFITGGPNGDNADVPPFTVLRTTDPDGGPAIGTLADYFGVPLNKDIKVSVLPFRAYGLIWNEWFRDQNLQTPVTIQKTSGEDTWEGTNRYLLNRTWEKDYFTSALPWPQRGTTPAIPLQGNALVKTVDGRQVFVPNGTAGAAVGSVLGSDQNLQVMLSEGTMPDIATLRQGFQIQKWMERNARAGARYIESILAHFGVKSSDARLQRPEFLGGGKSPVVVSEVLQTSETGATSPLATMAGHGFSAQRSHEFEKSFEEHGLVIGLLSIVPRTNYSQGIPKMWLRETRYDYYWPEFAHLGEQPIRGMEIYYANGASDVEVFGYQGRYDEYRRRESSIHGLFRTDLNFWHLGREFSSYPPLNSDFVKCQPSKRVFAVPSEPACLVQLAHNIQAVRPMPLVGEPGLSDHS